MTLQFTLERDGHDQPWGFRLQGGVDVGMPLSILRVLVGTPAESILKKGDVVSKISQTGTHNLSHQQAADLFNNAGNQINITVKRCGSGGTLSAASSQPSVSSLQASAAIRQQQQAQQAQAVGVASGGDPSQSPQVQALPRTTFVLKSDLPPTPKAPTASGDDFSVQNQPYRTLPLVQPSIRVINELGPGSCSHLRLQEEICTGVREPQLVPVTPAQANAIKANDYIMKQKVGFRSFRTRSPDPSVSIRSLLRPTPLFRGRSAWKDSPFSVAGRNTFKIGGQTIALKPTRVRTSGPGRGGGVGGFKPKPTMTPQMWRDMLKATPIKMKPKPKEVKKREALPEVTLRKQLVIKIATRDIMEEYCNQVTKDGVPGKKFKPKSLKPKEHEGIIGPAKMSEVEVLFLPGKRAVQISVVIRRFEEYEHFFTVGDKSKLPPGPCASFTFSLDYNKKEASIKPLVKSFETVDVEQTVNVTTNYDPMSVEV